MHRPAASSVGSMDEDNLKMKPFLVFPPASEKLVMHATKEELLAQIADITKKLRFMSLRAVLAVNLWVLSSACFLGGLSAYNIFGPSISHQQCLASKTCDELMCAAAVEARAIFYGLLCCSVLQAAAAVLAPLLTGRRPRRSLAYVALAAATVGHCMYGRIQWLLLAAYPGDVRIIHGVWLSVTVIALVDDLLFFVLLLTLERVDEDGGKESFSV